MARGARLGAKIRRLRQARDLTQAETAARLGISPSYLALIEQNERPVTVRLLLKLASVLDVDLAELSEEDERRRAQALGQAFADPQLAAHEVPPEEVDLLAERAPAAARAVLELYRAWRAAKEDAAAVTIRLPGARAPRRFALPTEEVRDWFAERRNYFDPLEQAAAELRAAARMDGADPATALAARLAEVHGIGVEVVDTDRTGGALRRFDPRAKRLLLAERLPRSSRTFHLAYQVGLIEARERLDALIGDAGFGSAEATTLARVGLASYFAGAVLMPYERTLEAAEATRYDVERLMSRFETSFEQVCHRLTTLQRPGQRAIPLFFIRADAAGNISKRLTLGGLHLARYGGSCPRWIVHQAFATPGLIRTQLGLLPDGTALFTVARAVDKAGGGYREPPAPLVVAIGCEVAHARALVYADAFDLDRLDAATTIGPGCRLCERVTCHQRAHPPLHHRLAPDPAVRGPSPYDFDPGAVPASPDARRP